MKRKAKPKAVPAAETFKYDAFISYRRTQPDQGIARQLHKVLETYRTPKRLVERGTPPRLRAVFRDVDELAAKPDLGAEIDQVLAESRFLIVVCSPRSRASKWVAREVETFRSLGRGDRILLLLIEGQPEDSFPAALLTTDEFHQPIAADLRADSPRAMQSLLKQESLRLLATILGCGYDDLKQRELERAVRRLWLVAGVLAALLAAAGFAIWQVTESRARAVESQARAEARTAELLVEQARTALAVGEHENAAARLEEAREHAGASHTSYPFLAARAHELKSAQRFDTRAQAVISQLGFAGESHLVVGTANGIEIRGAQTGFLQRTLTAELVGQEATLVGTSAAGSFVTQAPGGTPLLWKSNGVRVGSLLGEHVFDASGRRLLTWGERGLQLLDESRRVELLSETVYAATFCGPGHAHAFVGTRSAGLLLDLGSGAVLRRFEAPEPVTVVAVDESEGRFAFVTRPDGGEMRVFYVDTATSATPVDLGPGLDSQGLYFAGRMALLVNDVSYVTHFSLETRQKTLAVGAREVGSTNVFGGVAVGGSLFTTLGSYGVGVHRSADALSLHEIDADRYGLTFGKFAPRGPYLLTGGNEGVARLWNASSGALLAVYRGFAPNPVGAFSPAGALALAGGKRLVVWNSAVGGPLATLDLPLADYDNGLSGWHPDVVGMKSDGSVLFVDSHNEVKAWSYDAADAAVSPVPSKVKGPTSFANNQLVLASGTSAADAELVDLASGRRVRLEGATSLLSFSPDGRRLAGACARGGSGRTAGVWDASTGRRLATWESLGNEPLIWSVDGSLLASQGTSIRVRDAETGATISEIKDNAGASVFLDAATLLTVSPSGTLKSWDARRGALVEIWRFAAQEADNAEQATSALAVDPSGQYVAAAGAAEKTTTIYDRRTRRAVRQLPLRSLASLAFLDAGSLLLAQETSILSMQATIFDAATGSALRTYDGAATLARARGPVGEQLLITARLGGLDLWPLRIESISN